MSEGFIFVGDVALPDGRDFPVPQRTPQTGDCPLVVNLEGSLVADGEPFLHETNLYNSVSVGEQLRRANVQLCDLAKNHRLDIACDFSFTRKVLQQVEIDCIGAGLTSAEASESLRSGAAGVDVFFLLFRWETI